MERVSISKGESPIIIIAPHGEDDINTAYMAERIAGFTHGYCVINRGWKRGKDHDYWNDIANCNDIKHCHEDVVKEEFLDPILDFAEECKTEFGFAMVFIIHGVGNQIRKKASDSTLDVIVGSGKGIPPISSCDTKHKNYFISQLEKVGITAYEGKAGGKYAGRSKNNLNQLFRQWYRDETVDSLQIEIVKELRETEEITTFTADAIGTAIENLLNFDDTTEYTILCPREI